MLDEVTLRGEDAGRIRHLGAVMILVWRWWSKDILKLWRMRHEQFFSYHVYMSSTKSTYLPYVKYLKRPSLRSNCGRSDAIKFLCAGLLIREICSAVHYAESKAASSFLVSW